MKRILIGGLFGTLVGILLSLSIVYFFHITYLPLSFTIGVICGIICTAIGIRIFDKGL